MLLVSIKPSNRAEKKWEAFFKVDGKERRVSFGGKGYDDYTTFGKDVREDKRRLYRSRHKGDKLSDPTSPGALSWFILWGESPSMEVNLRAFKKRFGV
jgi:hypothetical protein